MKRALGVAVLAAVWPLVWLVRVLDEVALAMADDPWED